MTVSYLERDRETERQRDRETERQRDRETERQRDRETERLSERHRDKELENDAVGENSILGIIVLKPVDASLKMTFGES
jgi:hypothetical protein